MILNSSFFDPAVLMSPPSCISPHLLHLFISHSSKASLGEYRSLYSFSFFFIDGFSLFHILFPLLLFHSSEPKILFSYKSQIDEPEETDVHLPPTVATTLGRKEQTDQSLFYSSTQIDGSGPSSSRMVGHYLDDVASGPFGSSSVNSIEAERWRPINV